MDQSTSKLCVVTGGAGFIGSHLVERLLALGHTVRVIDNHSTGRPENLAHLRGNPGFSEYKIDLADPSADLQPILAGAAWVFHLAALADIVPSITKPLDYFHADVDGTAHLVEAAREAKVQRLIYAASSSCYGIPDHYPTPESAEIRPQYPYALAKNLGEQTVLHWGQVYDLPVVSLRLFNVYGPRSRTSGTYGAVFGVFLKQKLALHPYTIVGDGTQTRDFTYVTDVVDAFIAAAASSVRQEIMNVGSGGTYSVNRLVELLGGPVMYIPKRPGEPDCTFADTAKIRRLLQWKPQISFEQGVAKVLDNIEYWREAPLWTPERIAEATQAWHQFLKKSA
jgi:UDP-glucose 4-epimerase